MSTNLSSRGCYFCGYPKMRLLEDPHFRTKEELGRLFEFYEYVKFANAECPACLAEYIAWCDGVQAYMGVRDHHDRHKTKMHRAINDGGEDYEWLSFRSTFNDEYGDPDKPKREVRQAWVGEDNLIVAELSNHKEK